MSEPLYEVEQKFRIDDLPACRLRLESMGAIFEEPVRQSDLYFAHPTRDFKTTDEALRLRRTASDAAITYKGPRIDRATKTRLEIEEPLAEGAIGFERFRALFLALGFREVREVAKTRVPGFLIDGGIRFELALDSVQELGDFLEMELLSEKSNLSAAQTQIHAFAAKLALGEPEFRGYLDLLMQGR